MGEALAAAVAGRSHAHQTGVQSIMDIAFEDAIFDERVALGRRALVVDRQRAAAAADRAVIDRGHARRRDSLADAAGKGRGTLSVEIAFEAVTDRFVEQIGRAHVWT